MTAVTRRVRSTGQEVLESGVRNIYKEQALLLARTLRGDLDAYPPFFWG